jgi:hypothetical protein
MADDDSSVDWVKTDHRKWVPVTWHRDEITARMNVTYLDSHDIEARVGHVDDYFCVEVPFECLDEAAAMSEGMESGIVTPLQEERTKTGVHTGRHIRERLAAHGRKQSPRRLPWALALAVLIVVIAGIILILLR